MVEATEEGETESAVDATQVPPSLRFRLHHLMVLSMSCAVVSAISALGIDWADYSDNDLAYVEVYRTVHALLYGLVVGTVALMAWQNRRGGSSLPCAPGHWLVVLFVASFVVQLATGLAVATYRRASANPYAAYYSWHAEAGVLDIVGAVLCFAIASRVRKARRWATPFRFAGAASLLTTPLHLAPFLGIYDDQSWVIGLVIRSVAGVSIVAFVVRACLSDRADHVRRDWIHWFGVSVSLLFALATAADGVYWIAQAN